MQWSHKPHLLLLFLPPFHTSLLALPIAAKLGHVLTVLANATIHPHAVVAQAAPLASLLATFPLTILLRGLLSGHLLCKDRVEGVPHQGGHAGGAPLRHLLLLLLDDQLLPHAKLDSSQRNDGLHGRHVHELLLVIVASLLIAEHLVHHEIGVAD